MCGVIFLLLSIPMADHKRPRSDSGSERARDEKRSKTEKGAELETLMASASREQLLKALSKVTTELPGATELALASLSAQVILL